MLKGRELTSLRSPLTPASSLTFLLSSASLIATSAPTLALFSMSATLLLTALPLVSSATLARSQGVHSLPLTPDCSRSRTACSTASWMRSPEAAQESGIGTVRSVESGTGRLRPASVGQSQQTEGRCARMKGDERMTAAASEASRTFQGTWKPDLGV